MSEEKKVETKKEKKPMKKGLKIFLGVIIVLALASVAVFLVKMYFDKENSKPRFEEPSPDPIVSMTELPKKQDDAIEYALGLLGSALSADDVELNWSTGVDLAGEAKTPFNKADEDIVLFIRDRAPGQISSLYPTVSGELCATAEKKPEIKINLSDVINFKAEQGHTDENGNVSDDAFYFISFELAPSVIDLDLVKNGEIADGIEKILSSAMTVDALEVVPQSIGFNFKIDRKTDELLNLDISRSYLINADLTLLEEYVALTADGKAHVEFPYRANEAISFRHYGARFTQQQMVVKPDDAVALPADIKVPEEITAEDYEWTFDITDPDLLEIDSDGVMSVNDTEEEKIEYVTMHLKYNGHEYSDTIKVFITNKEVPTNG